MPAPAQQLSPRAQTGPGAPEDRPLAPLPEIAVELAEVPVSSEAHDAARDRLTARTEARVAALERIATAVEARAMLEVRDAELTQVIDAARREAERAEAEVERAAEALRMMVLSTYVRGAGAGTHPLLSLDVDAQKEWATENVAIDSLSRRQVRELAAARADARRARTEIRLNEAVQDGVQRGIVAAETARAESTLAAQRLAVEILESTVEVDHERRLARVQGADFPLVVLDAYWKASRRMALLAPGCGIPWWALAGIGKIESRHGTYGGAEVRPEGSVSRPIIGIPLTGSGGTAHIPDSDGGLLDGDPVYDRAVGPMQFIPQTWARWGADGTGDGEADPQNIYDAAASAAAYLCASGDLRDDAGLQRAFFSYNRSFTYVADVLAAGHGYRDAVDAPPST